MSARLSVITEVSRGTMTRSAEQLRCPVLIDRAAELGELLGMLEKAEAGYAQAAFLCGEAGIGKSRLAFALAESAIERGALTLFCHASPQDAHLSCAPIVRALQRAGGTLQPDLQASDYRLAPSHPQMRRLSWDPATFSAETPDEGAWLDSFEQYAPETPGLATTHRRRLFDRLFSALQTCAQRSSSGSAPSQSAVLVVVLEDLQWADETTLDFLYYLIQTFCRDAAHGLPSSTRLLVLATYRSEEVAEVPALLRMVGSILAQRFARQISLEPLSRANHAKLVAATLGQSESHELAMLLYEHAEGNPFVTEELLGAMSSAGYLRREGDRWTSHPHATLHLPISLRTAVLDRLARLTSAARDVLTSAAVIGREFDFATLQTVSGQDEASLLNILRRAVAQQLVAEDTQMSDSLVSVGEERYRFRHALTREVILGELLLRERRTLHRQVAEALESQLRVDLARGRAPTEQAQLAPRLAHHFTCAGLLDRAQPYAISAAHSALRLGGLAEAAEYLEIALAGTQPGDEERVSLLERLGTLRLSLMDMPRALESLGRAREEAASVGRRWRAAVTAVDLSYLLWFVDPRRAQEVGAAIVPEAEAHEASGIGSDEDAARLYAGAALCCAYGDDNKWASLWAARAERIAQDLHPGTERFLWRACVARGAALIDAGELEAGLSEIRRAIDIGRRYTVPDAVILAYNVLITALHEVGRDDRALSAREACLEYERQTGAVADPPTVLYSYLALGRWQEGTDVAHAQIARYREYGLPTPEGLALAGLGHLLAARGQFEDALRCLNQAWDRLSAIPQFVWASPCLWGLARVSAALGRRDQAADTYLRCYNWWRQTEDRGTAVPFILDGCLFFCDTADQDRARAWADDLQAISQITGNPVASAAASEGAGAVALSEASCAVAAERLRSAAEGWRHLGRPYDEARALARLGAAVLSAGPRETARRAEADRRLCAARDVYQSLGAQADTDAVDEVRRKAGLLSQARRRRTLLRGRAVNGGLTPREHDVLQLLVAGLSNRQIAGSLFIAESTAELHVSRILGKLGCATRAQAVACAMTQRLVSTEASGQLVGQG